MEDGRRIILTASDYVAVDTIRAVLGDSATVVPIEKKDMPSDEKKLWAVRQAQKMAVSAVLHNKHTIAMADTNVEYTLVGIGDQLEDVDESLLTPDGAVVAGVHISEAPPLQGSLLQASAALDCLYDLGPLRPGLRMVRDGLASREDCDVAVQAAQAALADAVAIGDRASVALTPDLVASGACSAAAYELLHSLRERCRDAVSLAFGEPECFHAGALLTRVVGSKVRPSTTSTSASCNALSSKNPGYASSGMDGGDTSLEAALPSYCHAHVDKCSILSYDISAVLYLSGPGNGLIGGSFAFLDSDGFDRHVHVKPGRLLAFTSGVANVHRVCEVEAGERVAIAMWFTLSKAHGQPQDELFAIPG